MSVATSPILGRPLWYELMTTDPSRAEAFYTTVVGWTASSFGGAAQPYTMLGRTPDAPVAGLMGRP
jgi:predicted enzyme related to lactoylglutathione lyase